MSLPYENSTSGAGALEEIGKILTRFGCARYGHMAELSAGWKARFTTVKADLEPVLAAIGTDWGSLFFCSFALFRHDGAIYVSTSAKLAPCMVEILASEYNAAKAAYESMKEAA